MKTPFFRVSAFKINLVAKLIRRMSLSEAALQLEFCLKKGASKISSLVKYAAHIGAQRNYNPSLLYVDQAIVGRGSYLKRIEARARGKYGIRKSPTSQVKLFIKQRDDHVIRKVKKIKRYIEDPYIHCKMTY